LGERVCLIVCLKWRASTRGWRSYSSSRKCVCVCVHVCMLVCGSLCGLAGELEWREVLIHQVQSVSVCLWVSVFVCVGVFGCMY